MINYHRTTMINKRITSTAMFNSFSQPCEVIDVLVDVLDGAFINMVVEVWSIGARADVVINIAAIAWDCVLR